jgi:hypothetical protein
MMLTWRAGCAIAAVVATAACSSTSSSTSRTTPLVSASTTVRTSAPTTSTLAPGSASTADASVPGDIPDDQAFVRYVSPAAGVSVDVPEGWARRDGSTGTEFTDKFNSVRIEVRPAAAAPTEATATAKDVPAIVAAGGNVASPAVATVTRKAGPAVLITYEADSAVNAVTGKSVREAVERYSFWRAGTEAVVTLAGAVGADNVDAWRRITDSVSWSP